MLVRHEFFNDRAHDKALGELPGFITRLQQRGWTIDAHIVYEVVMTGMTWRTKPYIRDNVQKNTHVLIQGSRHGKPRIGRYMYSHEQAKWIQKYRPRPMYAGSKWFWDHWILESDERLLALTPEEFIEIEPQNKTFNM